MFPTEAFRAAKGQEAQESAPTRDLFPPQAAASSGTLKLTLSALQNGAGSQAHLLATQRLTLAATATGLLGREAEIARAISPPVIASVAILVLLGALLGLP
jgi:lactate permease